MKFPGFVLSLALALGIAASQPAAAQNAAVSPRTADALARYDRATLVVTLMAPASAPSADPVAMTAYRQAIRDVQQRVIDDLGGLIAVDTRYATLPVLTVQTTGAGVEALRRHPLVVAIGPNTLRGPNGTKAADVDQLIGSAPRPIDPSRARGLLPTETVPGSPSAAGRDRAIGGPARSPAPPPDVVLAQPENMARIGAPALWGIGHTGAGVRVAVLDNGIDVSHPIFAGKLVWQACFSTHSPDEDEQVYSLCPGRATEAYGPGSASSCPDADLVPVCNHGTHVAGIAIGSDPSARVYGVAPQADLVAVQVFFRYYNLKDGEWTTGTLTADQLKALDYVTLLAAGEPDRIAAVNMSLSGVESFSGFCDDLAEIKPLRAAIDGLRNLNVLTVIAAGNENFRSAVGSPACISTAISVAATTAEDKYSVNAGTNLAAFPLVFVAAPGDQVLSAIRGGKYDRYSGTSMAAPMVAGALALLKAAYPANQPIDFEMTLARSGTPVMLADRYALPRLNLVQADAMLAGNFDGNSLTHPYQPNSAVSYIEFPAESTEDWSIFKRQLYMP